MRLAVIVLSTLFSPAILFSNTIYVPADYPHIQEAIDAAVNGDIVLVSPGTYEEHIDFKGKAITVSSVEGPDTTIIKKFWSVVRCRSGEGPDTVLDGFTIRNGTGTYIYTATYGGGMLNESSSPTVNNCIFYLNGADQGGGMCNMQNSSPTVTHCTFLWNEAVFENGGGMCNMNNSNPTVINCTFLHNRTIKEKGGGICNIASHPKITHCFLIQNDALYKYGGGMGNLQGSQPKVTNCVFYFNNGSSCGGMYNDNSHPKVTNCTFFKNGGGYNEGSIYNKDAALTLTNSILWDNAPKEIHNANSTVTVTYCCVEGGYPGTGNIDAYPQFVRPDDGDLHLTFPSPCKDSGDNSATMGLYDFEGDPRRAYGGVDMGADEFYTHLYWTGDATPLGNVTLKFVGLPGTTPVQLWLGSGFMDPPMPTKYGDWYLQFPLLVNVTLGSIPNPKGVLELPFTIPHATPTPLTLPLQAGIGLELTNLSVMDVK